LLHVSPTFQRLPVTYSVKLLRKKRQLAKLHDLLTAITDTYIKTSEGPSKIKDIFIEYDPEIITQINSPKIMDLQTDISTVKSKILYAIDTTHTVNYDRYNLTTEARNDTAWVATGIHRAYLHKNRRLSEDSVFVQGPQ
jgi:hypothetical protein